MSENKVWFITGAGRGMGVDIAKAALAAGNAVVATGRNTDTLTKALGDADDLLIGKLDVTSTDDAQARWRLPWTGSAAGQQRRQLLWGLLRGTDARAD